MFSQQLRKPPTFFIETNPQARKHTQWQQLDQDFTRNRSASRYRFFFFCLFLVPFKSDSSSIHNDLIMLQQDTYTSFCSWSSAEEYGEACFRRQVLVRTGQGPLPNFGTSLLLRHWLWKQYEQHASWQQSSTVTKFLASSFFTCCIYSSWCLVMQKASASSKIKTRLLVV